MLNLASLSLSTAHVDIILEGSTMLIQGQLGNLVLNDDSDARQALPDFKQIMSIEGRNLATFSYRTFDPNQDTYVGIKSSVTLNAGSVKVHFVEKPLHDLFLFFTKLAKLKGLYDAAAQVAIQRVSEIELMLFNITVKSPIVVLPQNPVESQDVLVLRLGEITAKNKPEALTNKIFASLRGIQLVSKIHYHEGPSILKIVDDIDIGASVIQTNRVDHTQESDQPDTQVISYPVGVNVI